MIAPEGIASAGAGPATSAAAVVEQAEPAAYDALLRAVRKLELMVEREGDARLTVEAAMSRSQFLILDCLAQAPYRRHSQSQLADHLGLTRAAVSRHVINAAVAGLLIVTSSRRSRREVEMRLTPEGRRRVRNGRACRAKAAAEVLAGVSAGQVADATTLLTQIAERVAGDSQARR